MNFAPAQRLSQFQTGIFAALNEKKDARIAAGLPVINLSVGTPDFKPFPHILRAVSNACAKPENYKYALADRPEMLDAVCAYYQKRFGVSVTPEEITSVHGTQEGCGHIGMALCNPGDLCLLPDPGYPIFEAGTRLGGAIPLYYPLVKENDFLPDLSGFSEEELKRVKYIIVSYPSNPTGAVAPKEMYARLIPWAKEHNILIINDNAYSDIIYDGVESFSFLSLPGARDIGVEFFSLSKSFNLTGARISFLIGNKSVIDALKLLRSQYDFGMFLPVQEAAIAALTGPLDDVRAQCKAYQERRDALCGGLRDVGWNVPDAKGTMFVWAPVPEGFSDSLSFCTELMEKTGVIGTPGSAFGPRGEGYIRFALVQPPEELHKTVQIIADSGILHK